MGVDGAIGRVWELSEGGDFDGGEAEFGFLLVSGVGRERIVGRRYWGSTWAISLGAGKRMEIRVVTIWRV